MTIAPSPIDLLAAEFSAWTKARGLTGSGDALELLMGDRTKADREWLSDFVKRWEAAAEADPAFYDKQTVVE
jgi:hypothetical protein